MCDDTVGCKSLGFCKGGAECYLYDKKIDNDDPQRVNADCVTSYQDCQNGNYF